MLLQATCELRVTGLKYPTFPHILGKGGRFRTALGYLHPESHLFFTYFGERWEISHRPGVSSPRKSLIQLIERSQILQREIRDRIHYLYGILRSLEW